MHNLPDDPISRDLAFLSRSCSPLRDACLAASVCTFLAQLLPPMVSAPGEQRFTSSICPFFGGLSRVSLPPGGLILTKQGSSRNAEVPSWERRSPSSIEAMKDWGWMVGRATNWLKNHFCLHEAT